MKLFCVLGSALLLVAGFVAGVFTVSHCPSFQKCPIFNACGSNSCCPCQNGGCTNGDKKPGCPKPCDGDKCPSSAKQCPKAAEKCPCEGCDCDKGVKCNCYGHCKCNGGASCPGRKSK